MRIAILSLLLPVLAACVQQPVERVIVQPAAPQPVVVEQLPVPPIEPLSEFETRVIIQDEVRALLNARKPDVVVKTIEVPVSPPSSPAPQAAPAATVTGDTRQGLPLDLTARDILNLRVCQDQTGQQRVCLR